MAHKLWVSEDFELSRRGKVILHKTSLYAVECCKLENEMKFDLEK